MPVAHFVDFKHREGERNHGWEVGGKSVHFMFHFFDAVDRRNEQPTTVKIIFSSP